MYGGMTVKSNDGKTVKWLWDYVNDKARLESEMTKEEIMASEKKKWEGIKNELKK
jgi:major membrane immunogen (membrane-anchored lipoprotein)